MSQNLAMPVIRWLSAAQLLVVVLAQYTIDPKSCIDPSGFESCFSNAQTGGGACQSECAKFPTSDICVQACGCVYFQEGINCVLTHCWNQVYSCGYQALAIGTLEVCEPLYAPPSPIPYFPAPANAPGGCSCNIGAAYNSIVEYNDLSTTCPGKSSLGDNTCYCCAISGIFSSLPDICPGQNTNDIPGYLSPSELAVVAPEFLGGCLNPLSPATCKAYGIPTPTQAVIPSFYTLNNIPSPGPTAISNKPGSLSSPKSGSVLTWTIDGTITNVVTAVQGKPTSGSIREVAHVGVKIVAIVGFLAVAVARLG